MSMGTEFFIEKITPPFSFVLWVDSGEAAHKSVNFSFSIIEGI